MYPSIYHLVYDWFGIEIEFLTFLNSFGFFVAIAFLAAAYFMGKELQRKESMGLLKGHMEKRLVGAPATGKELTINGLIGFVLGYKFIGMFLDSKGGMAAQDYIFSAEGNILAGIGVAALFVFLKYREKQKEVRDKPEWIEELVRPHHRVGEITMYAALSGIIGAKLFHQFENWEKFISNPIENLLSFSGLTFYGGLILGTITVVWYVRKKKFSVPVVADVVAPSLMLSYALGRVGCQVSGDGDWGINNTAPKPDWMSFLPDWMWAYRYPHNVNGQGIPISDDCGVWEGYCNQLEVAVFPTPFYETIMCVALFALLWFLRKKINVAGMLFFIYLALNGLERFLIEKIRVNNPTIWIQDMFNIDITQAEIISSALMLTGIVGAIVLYKRSKSNSADVA